MKLTISLGSRSLVFEPETEFEQEIMKKYFQDSDVTATIDKSNSLWIKFSGPASQIDVTEEKS